jgi:histidine phosphotransferase ChpT
MHKATALDETALAALISSKICHDLAGQIGAINNGLEILEDESDDDTRHYALEVIQNSAKLAWAQLDFHRLAFGASSGLGDTVPEGHIEKVARSYIENGKRRLHWQVQQVDLPKSHAKLVLSLLAVALTALPAGGDLYVGLLVKKPGAFKLLILSRGRLARVPEKVPEIFAGQAMDVSDTKLIVPYYASRLAANSGIALRISKDGEDIVLSAEAANIASLL